jgi:hypothetical protein
MEAAAEVGLSLERKSPADSAADSTGESVLETIAPWLELRKDAEWCRVLCGPVAHIESRG